MGYKNFTEKMMKVVFFVCGITAIVFTALISIYMVVSGLPAILEIGIVEFMFGTIWKPSASEASFGILPLLLSSLYATVVACLLGVPIGVLTAVFLSKIASKKIASVIRTAVELLASIPSVVYGLVGAMLLLPIVADVFNLPKGSGLFSAIIVLCVMILPTIISLSENALNAVPKEYEEASLALGASQTETIFKVSIPAAKSGIIAGVILGVGRAIGETMAVMMVAGNVANMPKLFESVAFLTTAVAKDMGYASGLHRESLFSVALILLIFILAINLFMNFIVKKGENSR